MIELIPILSLIPVFLYLGIVFKQDMQMMQQNSYRNERYIKWLKMNKESSSSNRLLDIVMLALILGFNFSWAYILVDIILIFAFVRLINKKYKKPVVFTKRVWRLYIANWVASIAIIIATYFINPGYMLPIGLLIAALSYILTMGTNWLLKPVEQAINQSFVDDAKRILSQMPDMKIIGITGSYGKTSTKHYLNRILSEKYDVLMTPGSFNTPMGVVRTVREQLKPYNNLFIVEMGAKNIGDIKEICDLVHPSMGIITAVGPQHLESFKTIENVQCTKFELADALPSDGLIVVNNDFPYVANREVTNVECKRYGVSHPEKADYKATDIEYTPHGTKFIIEGDGRSIELSTKLVGECNISNLMAAVIMAMRLDVPEDKIKYAVSKIEQVEHRLNMKKTAAGITIIDDAFNSNPDGSKMALDVLSMMKGGKRIVITPGMIELGDKQEEYNKIFGEHIVDCCDVAIIVGQYNRNAIVAGIEAKGMKKDAVYVVDSFNEAQEVLKKIAVGGDTVLYENDLPDTFK